MSPQDPTTKKHKKSKKNQKIASTAGSPEDPTLQDPQGLAFPQDGLPHPRPKKPRWVDHPTFGFDVEGSPFEQSYSSLHRPSGKKAGDAERVSSPQSAPLPPNQDQRHSRKIAGQCTVLLSSEALDTWAREKSIKPWMLQRIRLKKNEWTYWTLDHGPHWVLFCDFSANAAIKNPKLLSGQRPLSESSLYAQGRDLGSQLIQMAQEYALSNAELGWIGHDGVHAMDLHDFLCGLVTGLELGAYRFKNLFQGPLVPAPRFSIPTPPGGDWKLPLITAVATNLARHLVNLPSNVLHPGSYPSLVESLFKHSHHIEIEIWDHKRLIKERCQLLCAVGGASQHAPALIHLKYRSQKRKGTHQAPSKNHPQGSAPKPIVFVAKGITFDSGGLNIKDSGGMRLMKKDMGGSASALALAWWLDQSGIPVDCDFYLAIAENSIGSRAFRPGDILTSRSGVSVEIDNTDAEGRLVLADAIDVALEHHLSPRLLVNFATLTGAMRVALGTKVAGYFTTVPTIVGALEKAALKSGEPIWQMPLFPDYRGHLKSQFSDLANSGPQRFGAAISAALFLQRFVGNQPWLHIDHYAWNDSAGGGTCEAGGSGQLVQLFAGLLQDLASQDQGITDADRTDEEQG